jgi:hypothetical protein
MSRKDHLLIKTSFELAGISNGSREVCISLCDLSLPYVGVELTGK